MSPCPSLSAVLAPFLAAQFARVAAEEKKEGGVQGPIIGIDLGTT